MQKTVSMCQHFAINFFKDPNRNITLKSIMFPTKEVVKHLYDSRAVNFIKETVVLSRRYQSRRSWQKIMAQSASRGDLPTADPTDCYFTPSSKSWVVLINSIDKCVLTSPWSRSRERVRRIIATIKLEELSNNLYGICAGCHPLMLSARLGVPWPSAMGNLFYCYFLTPQVFICVIISNSLYVFNNMYFKFINNLSNVA